MYTHEDRSANLLGALSLLVEGEVRAAVSGAVSGGGVLAEAVIAVKDQPGVTVDWLSRVLRVSQPGAVHVVNRMVELGWVEKRPGADARSRALFLTRDGKSTARAILRARRQALRELVDRLSPWQREQLSGIAGTLLRPLPRTDQDLARLCRLCERACCGSCPVHEGLVDNSA
jgi:DNA-binding MarR family transcriptional regulator